MVPELVEGESSYENAIFESNLVLISIPKILEPKKNTNTISGRNSICRDLELPYLFPIAEL